MDDAPLIEKTAAPNEVLPPAPRPKPVLEAGAGVAPIIPRTLEEVARFADAVIAADLVPDSYSADKELPPPEERITGPALIEWRRARTKSRVMIGVMKGLEVGMGPLTALSTIAIINNRPSIWGDGAVALAQRDGKLESFKRWYDGKPFEDDYTCHVEIGRRGQSEPYRGAFSVANAKRARLWGNTKKAPWIEHPERMLFNRARAFALRDGFADCLMGLSIAEEVLDLDTPKPEAKPDTSFLDDAPAASGVPAIEHKPEIPMTTAAPANEPVAIDAPRTEGAASEGSPGAPAGKTAGPTEPAAPTPPSGPQGDPRPEPPPHEREAAPRRPAFVPMKPLPADASDRAWRTFAGNVAAMFKTVVPAQRDGWLAANEPAFAAILSHSAQLHDWVRKQIDAHKRQ